MKGTIVRCPICGETEKTCGLRYFHHCGRRLDIKACALDLTQFEFKSDENGRKKAKNRQRNSTGIHDQTGTTGTEDIGTGKTTEREEGNFLTELGIEQRRISKAKTEN